MPQPTDYEQTTDFSEYQDNNPDAPFNGANHDTEFGNIALTLSEVLANLSLIQRDDGKLANTSVHMEALSDAVKGLFIAGSNFKGAWVTATSYAVGESVSESGTVYLCVEAHTSGTFATDLSAGKWAPLPAVGDTLDVLDALTPAPDKFPYFTSGSAAALADFTSKARDLLAETTESGMRGVLEVGSISTETANFNVATDGYGRAYILNGASGDVTATLPALSGVSEGWWAEFINAETSHKLTVDGNGAETIEGVSEIPLPGLSSSFSRLSDWKSQWSMDSIGILARGSN